MQTLVQTQKIDQLKQEVHELREEVTTLRAEMERLANLVSSLTVTQDQPSVHRKPQPLCMQPPQQRHQPLCIRLPQQQAPQQLNTQNHAPRTPVDPIPIRYTDLLPTLLKNKLVQTRAPPSMPERLPAGYRADLTCDFHQGAPGHDIEHCFALKKVVQKLIKADLLSFEDPDSGMQIDHPVPEQYQQQPRQQAFQQRIPHNQAQKALQFDPIPIKYAELLPTSLKENLVQTKPPSPIPKKLSARWRPDLFCAFHQGAQGHDVKHCFSLKIEVQKLINANVLPFKNLNPSM